MSLQFDARAEAHFEDLLSRYPTKQAALVPTLYLAQDQFGYLSVEVMEYVAGRLGLPASQVLNTATFYTLLHKKPVGKHWVQVCTNVSCYLRGCDDVVEALKKRLNIELGDTTPDKRFTLEEVECAGSCGTAPVMQVNLEFYENLTPQSAVAIIDSLDKDSKPDKQGK
jgi:NADH-quinone oxidoreductase E subunit